MNEKMRHRVVYSCLLLPVRLGLAFGLSMRELIDLLQMAAFHETRRRDMKMREVSELLDVSMRKVSQLSSRLRRNFAAEEILEELPRRIEFMLWAEPMSEARIHQVLRGASGEEVDEALDLLVEQARVRRITEGDSVTYEVSRAEFRLVSQDWLARLDGLNNLVANLANAVDARFFEDEPAAFARTVSLRIRPEDLDRLHALYSDQIWETLRELDAAAHDDPTARPIDLSIAWAPYEFVLRKLRGAPEKITT